MIEPATSPETCLRAVAEILRPLVRVAVQEGVDRDALVRALDEALDEAGPTLEAADPLAARMRGAMPEAAPPGTSPDSARAVDAATSYERLARVVSWWNRSRAEFDPAGVPMAGEGSFTEIVERALPGASADAVRSALEASGAIEHLSDGQIALKRDALITHDRATALHAILGNDVARLIETIAHNAGTRGNATRFQRKVEYDAIPLEASPVLQAEVRKLVLPFLTDLDRLFSTFDAETRAGDPAAESGDRGTAGFGLYYYERPPDEPPDPPGARRASASDRSDTTRSEDPEPEDPRS